MADNINTLPSTDVTAVPVATDEVGGAHYQIIKTAFGADGVATGVEDVNGSRFPVGGAQIGATNETAPVTDTATAGLNGRLQRVAQRLTTLLSILPPSIGNQTAGDSLGVTLSDDNYLQLGAQNETAPAGDTDTAGLNGRLQRIAQRLTTLIGRLPSALGSQAAAASLGVTASTEDIARIGATNETAPASDTATSGLNGRLQRIAQRLTSLIAQIPATLGQKTMANSFAVVLASDQSALSVNQGHTGTQTTFTLTVANGANDSNSVDLRGWTITGVIVPSTFDGTNVVAQVSIDNSTWFYLYDPLNNQVAINPATAGRAYSFWVEVTGWPYFRLQCATAQSTTDTIFSVVAYSRG